MLARYMAHLQTNKIHNFKEVNRRNEVAMAKPIEQFANLKNLVLFGYASVINLEVEVLLTSDKQYICKFRPGNKLETYTT